jgi:trimeric autotransporter adhesin
MINKILSIIVLLCSLTVRVKAQNVGIGTNTPHASAKLEINDTAKGILIPRLTIAQRNAIASPAKGLMVFVTTDSGFYFFDGNWKRMSAANEGWRINGNNNTDTNHFIGTIHNESLRFRVNNTKAGEINPAFGNVSFGVQSLNANTSGLLNTAIGFNSMKDNINGRVNTAIGAEALVVNTVGSENTAFGVSALSQNTNGFFNTAVGSSALRANTTGSFNTAIGRTANVSADNLSNATAIGFGAVVNASNKIRLGNSSVTVIEGQVPFTSPSDGRFKTNIKENVSGLNFIMQLRPVTYNFKTAAFDNFLNKNNNIKSGVLKINYTESENILHTGFIAQEVEQAANKVGFKFDGLVIPKNENETYSLSYAQFVVPLVKAMQEQQLIIEKLTKQVEAASVAEIPTIVGKQQKIMEEQQKKIERLEKIVEAIKK